QSTSLKTPLASSFSKNHSNLERLLQIEFQTLFINDQPFQLDQFNLLSHSISYIDTVEFLFHGFIVNNNRTLFIDQDMFISDEQNIIETLRLIFNCTTYDRVEWELVKSIQRLPQSPCSQQIQFLRNHSFNNNQYYSPLIILVGLTIFLVIKQKQIILIFRFFL
ncbi:unnamed protein product, partial [Rotaria sp. Silwood2]